jgi:16S rRNA (cytosine967-C5)-methyltransferase
MVQPALFLRLRPFKNDKVLGALTAAAIPFIKVAPNTLALANGSKMPETLILNLDYVVQDYGSQQVGDFIAPYVSNLSPQANIWDCCAASGGKSIMLSDLGFTNHLYVSDIRASILTNLSQRFAEAGITKYTSFLADLTVTPIKSPLSHYELILADVPCSGSGTWGRTPEQLSFVEEENLLAYAQRQKIIVRHLSQFLKPGGLLVYITCSVFIEENEEVVNTLIDSGFEELSSQYMLGYTHKADSMYVSILQKK